MASFRFPPNLGCKPRTSTGRDSRDSGAESQTLGRKIRESQSAEPWIWVEFGNRETGWVRSMDRAGDWLADVETDRE